MAHLIQNFCWRKTPPKYKRKLLFVKGNQEWRRYTRCLLVSSHTHCPPHTRLHKYPPPPFLMGFHTYLPFLSLKPHRKQRGFNFRSFFFIYIFWLGIAFLFCLCACCVLKSGFLLGDFWASVVLDEKMKRASVSFNQSHAIDDEAKTKFKYQTLLNEYLELQKECVSKKRKLQAAKQKRETLLSEVRFLRQRRKYLLKSQAPNVNKEPLQLPNLDSESNTLHSGRNQSAPEVAPKSFDQVLVSNWQLKRKLGEEYDKDARVTKNQKNHVLQDKGASKRNICWPDQVTLKV